MKVDNPYKIYAQIVKTNRNNSSAGTSIAHYHVIHFIHIQAQKSKAQDKVQNLDPIISPDIANANVSTSPEFQYVGMGIKVQQLS